MCSTESPASGTTSAYAENTVSFATTAASGGNYLRVRGEYLLSVYMIEYSMELPPRTRRIPPYFPAPAGSAGTTSAYAENTHDRVQPCETAWNYLRVRGEY